MKTTLLVAAAVLASAVAAGAGEPNTLTEAEKKAGWKLLFDGQTTKGWRGYKMQTMPLGWTVTNDILARVQGGAGGKGAGGGDDIVTTEEFEDFELSLEWKLVPNGNSGVLYRVSEEPVTAWHYAPEVQLLDNTAHRTRNPKQLAGACYDLYAPSKDLTKPTGQWNVLRVIVKGPHAEHWMNGEKVVEYEIGSEDWKKRVAESKFKGRPKFATFKKGPICLQDHSDRVEFCNIKIRPLPAKSEKQS
jgi:cytochrome c